MAAPMPAAAAGPAGDTLFVWRSPALRDILPLFLKPSQNQIGETLLRTLGGEVKGLASVDSGRAAVREVLREFGVADDAYVIADGSGLSRYDYVAPETLTRILEGMARRADFDVFYQALPIAGVDGTIAGRMRGTAAAGNVHAKTGSIANVRSLSGYVTSAEGERFVFVIVRGDMDASEAKVRAALGAAALRPATAAEIPEKAAMMADDGVVLPIPISPVPRSATPSDFASRASVMPASRAATASSRVMAGPLARFFVPRAIFRSIRPGTAPKSKSTPISTTRTSAPA